MAKKTNKVRVNMRLYEDLVKWVKKYAKKRRTNMTRIVTEQLSQLKEQENGSTSVHR